VSVNTVEIVLVACAALTLTLFATLYSASKAGNLTPVKGIRYIE